jgi:predicted nucleic acid-binding protein
MARVYWDSMLFIYMLDEDSANGQRVAHLFESHLLRGDEICTSFFTLGEVFAGSDMRDAATLQQTEEVFRMLGLTLIPFAEKAAAAFGLARRTNRISPPDSIHAACASAYGVDLFLTADKRLSKLQLPGIHFVADLHTNLF